MTGRKLFLAVSLLLPALAPVRVLSADVKAHSSSQYLRYNDSFQSLNDPDNAVVFSGNKADFFQVTARGKEVFAHRRGQGNKNIE